MKTLLSVAIAAAVSPIAFAAADCGDFPNRPIEVMVPYRAGGAVDIAARTLANAAAEVKGWDLRIANRTGAGTVTGQEHLANQASRDGYTVGVMPLLAAVLNESDAGNGIEPGSIDVLEAIFFDPWLFVARPGETIESLVSRGEAGRLRYAYSPGSEQSMLGGVFESRHGFQMARVPLDGGVNRIGGVLNGSVDIAPTFYGEAKQYLDSGVVTPLGYANDAPYWAGEDIPALTQEGYDFGANFWGAYRVVFTPAGVPDDIKACLSEGFTEILSSEAGKALFMEQGIRTEPVGYAEASGAYPRFQQTVAELLAAGSQ